MAQAKRKKAADPAPASPQLTVMGRQILERPWNEEVTRLIALSEGISDFHARLLNSRGLDVEGADRYLHPSLKHLAHPEKFSDMKKGARFLADALQSGKKIFRLSDYDTDGATASSIVGNYLAELGHDSQHYVPDRQREGYGGNEESIRQLKARGADVIIMLDCGTSANAQISLARSLGMDVIVIDHHPPRKELCPDAVAIINPARHDDESQSRHLVAAGVAFTFICAMQIELRQRGFFTPERPEPRREKYLAEASLGTIVDMGDIIRNRPIVYFGLIEQGRRANPGLRQLMLKAGMAAEDKAPTLFDNSFVIGPRLNAPGRIDETDLGIRLLTARDPAAAYLLAEKICSINQTRQTLDRLILDHASEQAQRQVEAGASVIVLADRSWHIGVVGIVAARLRERYDRPAVVFGHNPHENGDVWVGSGRSVDDVDLGDAVVAAMEQGIALKAGGHPMAAGVTIAQDQLDNFRTFMQRRVGQLPPSRVYYDAIIDAGALTVEFIRLTESKLGPFGKGNPEPTYLLKNMGLDYAEMTSKGDHLRCRFRSVSGASIDAMGWRMVDWPIGRLLLTGDRLQPYDLIATASVNEFNGRVTPQLTIVDIAPSGQPASPRV